MSLRAFAAVFLVLTFATPVFAKGKAITTHALVPHVNGLLGCTVVNASESKELLLNLWTYTNIGGTARFLGDITVLPGKSYSWDSVHDGARFCRIEFVSGKSKDARISVWVTAPGGPLSAAVAVSGK